MTAASETARRLFALAGLLGLAACAGGETPAADDPGRFVEMPETWQDIDLAEADLTLPLITPVEISTLGKRVGEGQVFENFYTFRGIKGYALTSRIAFGHYTERVSRRLRSLDNFKSFAADLTLPPNRKLDLVAAHPFANGDPHTQGFYAEASTGTIRDRCFVARVGYLMVEYASIDREPDAVDTIVEVLLCGHLPPEPVLLDLLGQLKAVDDRAAFRKELSKLPIGTI